MRTRFIQDTGTYQTPIMVSVGSKTEKEILKDCLYFNKEYKLVNEYILEGCAGQYSSSDRILWLRDYENNDYWNDVLRHEVIHCVQFEFDRRGMTNEHEAFAYQVDYLIDEIRKKLTRKIKV